MKEIDKIYGGETAGHYKRQEKVSNVVGFVLNPLIKLNRYFYHLFKINGFLYGVRRAYWRARVKKLGKYSDIGPNANVKFPERLSIGERCCIGWGSFVDAAGEIEIGDHVMISHLVSINSITHPTSPPFNQVITKKVVIHSGAWIGAHAVILEGAQIGEGAIVAAGAVVNRDVEPWTIVAGVPARKIRDIKREV